MAVACPTAVAPATPPGANENPSPLALASLPARQRVEDQGLQRPETARAAARALADQLRVQHRSVRRGVAADPAPALRARSHGAVPALPPHQRQGAARSPLAS